MKNNFIRNDSLIEADLDRLLNEDILSVKDREKNAFDRLTAPFGKSLVLFGAGNLGRQVLARLRQDGIEPLAFADNNPSLWGKIMDGIKVLPPEDASLKYGQRATFVVTIWRPGSCHQFRETKQKLLSLNCANPIPFLSLVWKYSERFLPNCFLDLPHKIIVERENVKKSFHVWDDEESRMTYVSQLKWRMLESYDALPARSSEMQYFPTFFIVTGKEIFIDCGACDGDTIKDFLSKTNESFLAIQAFEPDPLNFGKLSEFVNSSSFKEKFVLHQKAIGARFETVNFTTTGTASSAISTTGQTQVESVPLDEILKSSNPTFIKMDIEGAEIDALLGAKKTIKKSLPVLAICVYHQQDHLWKIPLLLKTFSKEYKLFLRAHQEEGWDLVSYAIPANRLKV